jgi:adenylate cyclase
MVIWQTVSGSDRVEEYLHYLEQFPDGEFAALARARIADLSQAKPTASAMPADTAVELSFWDSVKGSDNPAMYRAYLEKYPDGNFISLAKAKLEELAKE